MIHIIAVIVLAGIVVANVIIAMVYVIAARRRNSREAEWHREIEQSSHPKLKNRYPD